MMSLLPAKLKMMSNRVLFLALLIFAILTIPFIGSIPYLDGNIDFVKSYNFLKGGVEGLLTGSRSIHPPIKEILTAVFFRVGGLNPVSYGAIGPIFGILGIVAYYFLLKTKLSPVVAITASLLLATSPLFLATGVFALTDYLLTVFLLISFYFYTKQKYFLYFLSASFAVLTKETGIVFVASTLLAELVFSRKNFKKIVVSITPLITITLWSLFLKINGQGFWSDWNFSETSGKGTVYTILNNILTLKIFNKYAYQNWLQVLILNFNWLLWIVVIIGAFIAFARHRIKENIFKNKTVFIALVFYLTYFFAILSFQTYAIPRYALPLEPFFYIAIAYGSYKISEKSKLLKLSVSFFLIGITVLRLFTSLDPISSHIWGKTEILGQDVYALNQAPSLSGFDGITYNMQYNLAVKRRSDIILGKYPDKDGCAWLFPDPTTDIKTIKIIDLRRKSLDVHCFPSD